MGLQRTINWAGALRDMRNYRSPEKRLASECLETLKEADEALERRGVLQSNQTRRRLFDLIQKMEAQHG